MLPFSWNAFFTWLPGFHIPLVFLQLHWLLLLSLPCLLLISIVNLWALQGLVLRYVFSLFLLNYAHFLDYLIYSPCSNCYLSLLTPKCISSLWLSLLTLDSTVYFISQLGGATDPSHLVHPKTTFLTFLLYPLFF